MLDSFVTAMSRSSGKPTVDDQASRGSTPDPQPVIFWVAAHNCPHCAYAHVVSLDPAPSATSVYRYECPVTGQSARFAATEVSLRRHARPFLGAVGAVLDGPGGADRRRD